MNTKSLFKALDKKEQAKKEQVKEQQVMERTIYQKRLESKLMKLSKTFKNNLNDLTKLDITKETWNLCLEAILDTTVDIANAFNEYCEIKYIETTEGVMTNEIDT